MTIAFTPTALSPLASELTDWLRQRFPDAPASAHAAATLCAQAASEGHVCLSLPELAGATWQGDSLPPLEDWLAALCSAPFVTAPGGFAPLVLDGDLLYLGRLWADEVALAGELARRAGPSDFSAKAVATALAPWFADSEADASQWQAAATALANRMAVIAGGPGTGKTTTVAKLLAALASLAPASRVQLAAPTGKAAARMVEALDGAKQRLGMDLVTQAALPTTATTLHRLLGFRPDSATPRHGPDNPLTLDLLIVDEASMIDQALFARLLQALPDHAQLILLGDPDQLASVEAGSCFADLVSLAQAGDSALGRGIARLTVSHRFGGAIGALALVANGGDSAGAFARLRQGDPALAWHPGRLADWQGMLLQTLDARLNAYRAAIATSDVEAAWAAFGQLRILCALREGPCGVAAINRLIEARLWREAQRQDARHAPWYAGRPVIVRANAPALGLSNGDIGLTLATREGLRVAFPLAGGWRWFAPARVPAHDTAFAMTVHQSQGSEFSEAWLVLPDDDAPVLSRSLVYTALTRARDKVVIWGSASTLAASIDRDMRRMSGLAARLRA
jgi:exodeoxyribonuclease V alpha subunit